MKNYSLDDLEAAQCEILDAVLKSAPFDGWTWRSLEAAVRKTGNDAEQTAQAFPGGIRDVLRFWSESLDTKMFDKMTGDEFDQMKIREKVAFGVRLRLEALDPHKEAARRAAALLATPPYAGLGAKLSWNMADAIWRGLGDQSTDFNYYTKRAILNGVWLSTFARWLSDDSADRTETEAFLAARIDNVMQIEKAKAQFRKMGFDPAKPIGALAKLRFGDR